MIPTLLLVVVLLVAVVVDDRRDRDRRDLEDYCDALEHKCRVLGRHV